MSKKRRASVRPRERRTHSIVITLNDHEYAALQKHCARKQLQSRSGWIRSLIMTEVISSWERESPMLFSEADMQP